MVNTIVLYTASFPYEGGESFIADELPYLLNVFDRVLIVPYQRKGVIRCFPEGVEIVDWKKWMDKKVVKASLGGILMSELKYGENRSAFIRNFRAMRYILKQRGLEAIALQSFIEDYQLTNALHYTYWFDHWTLSLALLKEEGLISKLISRAHGFDLYHDRTKSGLIPFRYFTLSMLNKIFLISSNGHKYLAKRFPKYQGRMEISYLGTADIGVSVYGFPKTFTILSCSTAKPLKRLHLLFKAFLELEIPAKWVHIGDGQTLAAIKKELVNLPDHLEVDLLGHFSSQEVINYYQKNAISLFVNVSETEGLPVSIMEAISFGIPVLATDVGGTSEIVLPQCGELLPANVSINQLAERLLFWSDKSKTINRKDIHLAWKESFSADTNYRIFCAQLNEIN